MGAPHEPRRQDTADDEPDAGKGGLHQYAD
jgi:hypothetical protein